VLIRRRHPRSRSRCSPLIFWGRHRGRAEGVAAAATRRRGPERRAGLLQPQHSRRCKRLAGAGAPVECNLLPVLGLLAACRQLAPPSQPNQADAGPGRNVEEVMEGPGRSPGGDCERVHHRQYLRPSLASPSQWDRYLSDRGKFMKWESCPRPGLRPGVRCGPLVRKQVTTPARTKTAQSAEIGRRRLHSVAN